VALEDLAAEFNLRTQVSVELLNVLVLGQACETGGGKGIISCDI
jgi:hypothetical protein